MALIPYEPRITPYEEFQIDDRTLAKLKEQYAERKVKEHYERHGALPRKSIVQSYYNIPSNLMEEYKKALYSKFYLNSLKVKKTDWELTFSGDTMTLQNSTGIITEWSPFWMVDEEIEETINSYGDDDIEIETDVLSDTKVCLYYSILTVSITLITKNNLVLLSNTYYLYLGLGLPKVLQKNGNAPRIFDWYDNTFGLLTDGEATIYDTYGNVLAEKVRWSPITTFDMYLDLNPWEHLVFINSLEWYYIENFYESEFVEHKDVGYVVSYCNFSGQTPIKLSTGRRNAIHTPNDNPCNISFEPINDSQGTCEVSFIAEMTNYLYRLTQGENGYYDVELVECINMNDPLNYESEWLELPVMDDDSLTYRCHYFTLNGKEERNYTFAWSSGHGLSKWVAYPLNERLRGSGSRTDSWDYDPLIPINEQPLGTFDGGWTRNLLIPSADRLHHDANIQAFYSTNMAPANYDLDGGALANIESKIRNISSELNKTIYVVSGVIVDDDGEKTSSKSGQTTTTIPTHFYKTVLIHNPNGNSDLSSSNPIWRTYTVLIENSATAEPQYMSIGELENATGMCFFPNLKGMVGEEMYSEIKAQPTYKGYY